MAQKSEKCSSACSSIIECISINRMVNYLKVYQSLEESQYHTLQKIDHNDILNDFNHIIAIHLSDQKPINETKQEFEEIHDYITKHLNKCDLEKCKPYTRNNRNRENDSNQQNTNTSLKIYIDTLDSMHCFFIHCFHIGFRIRSNEINEINKNMEMNQNTENDKEGMDQSLYTDEAMIKLSSILTVKRKRLENVRGTNRCKNNKFVTNINNDEDTKVSIGDGDNDDDKNNEQMQTVDDEKEQQQNQQQDYSFGFKYYYWHWFKDNEETEKWGPNCHDKYCDWYVSTKYKDLKDELINNKIFKLDLNVFENECMQIAIALSQTEHSKTFIADNTALNGKYGIKKDSSITVEHLASVLLYCNFDILSYEFSKTFRKINKMENVNDCKERNKEFAIWSRLLRETVELFGTEIYASKINIYYHGVSPLIFNSFVSYFASPTSCSAQLSVATIFAKNSGLIIELKQDDWRLRYFNCSWVSCYPSEDEKLFVGGYGALQFSSIRDVANNENYQFFVHSITSLNYAVIGEELPHQHKFTKRDIKILRKLIAGNNSKFPKYVNDIFKAFCVNKQNIRINVHAVNTYYPLIASLLFDHSNKYIVLINSICNIFKNCEKIQIEYDYEDQPELTAFLDTLYSNQLLFIDSKQKQVNITIKNVVFDDLKINKYSSQFNQNNWYIKKEDFRMVIITNK